MNKTRDFLAKAGFIISLLIMGFVIAGHSQNAKQTADGNYISASANNTTEAKETGKTYTDAKGQKYPVYTSKSGKLFIIRTSIRTGNKYNQYLKL